MELTAAVKHLCRRAAPHELRNRPIYIRFADTPGDGWAAYTYPALDLLLRDEIGRAWRGRGWAVVVRRGMFAADEWGALELALYVFHELAHAVTWPKQPVALSPERLTFERRALRHMLTNLEPSDTPTRDASHGLAWHRAAIHLAYRAQRAGWDIRPTWGLGIGWYGDFAPEEAVAALGDEPARMADVAFKTILATPAPIEFRNLFFNQENLT